MNILEALLGKKASDSKHMPSTLRIYTGPSSAPVAKWHGWSKNELAHDEEAIRVKTTNELRGWYSTRHDTSGETYTLLIFVFPDTAPAKASDASAWYNSCFAPELERISCANGLDNSQFISVSSQFSLDDGGGGLIFTMKQNKDLVMKLLDVVLETWSRVGPTTKDWRQRFS